MSKRRQEVGVLRPRRGNHAAQLHVTQCPCDGVGQATEGRGGERRRSQGNVEDRRGMEVARLKERGVKEWRWAAVRGGTKWNKGGEFKGNESKRSGVERANQGKGEEEEGRGGIKVVNSRKTRERRQEERGRKRSEEMRGNGEQGKERQGRDGGKVREKRKNKSGRDKGKEK